MAVHNQAPVLLTPAEVAEMAGLSTKSVYRAIKRGELPASRLGAVFRIRIADFDTWVDSARVAVTPAASVQPRPAAPPSGGPGSHEALLLIEAEAA